MKEHLKQILQTSCLLAFAAAISTSTQAQTTWNGGGGDGEWNTALNWDAGVPTEGVSAIVPAGNTVNYTLPMTATSFASLGNSGVLNVNTNGFNVSNSGDGAVGATGSAAKIFINAGGVVTLSAGGLTLSNAAALSVNAGGSLSVAGNFFLGKNGTGNVGSATNNGGTISAAVTSINPNNNSSSSRFVINGGTNDLGAVTIQRSASSSFEGLGNEGLVIFNGLARMTSLDVGGSGNSHLTMYVGNGVVTNAGNMIVRQGTAGRSSRFLQNGGLFVSEGASGVNLRGHTANNVIVMYSVLGGTNLVTGFTLGNIAGTDTTGTVRLTNSAKIYIGGGGIASAGTLNTKTIVLNSGGIFGAQTDWSGTEPIIMAGGTFDAADLDGTPHNISLSGVLSGSGAMNKTGAGVLTLNAANTYSGQTFINQGTLALAGSGSIANSSQVNVSSGATFDVSAIAYSLAAGKTLAGAGSIAGDVIAQSGSALMPGFSAGTLTFSNNLTFAGGVVSSIELSGGVSDLINVVGTLDVSAGINNIVIAALGGSLPAGTYPLFKYGTLVGDVSNFTFSGAPGVLTNDTVGKTISLITSGVRAPASIVWVGNTTSNVWNVLGTTNWLNGAALDYFVQGDSALFNGNGAASPVQVTTIVNPALVTVDSAVDYTFTGSGNINGSAILVKTNTGKLTIQTTNTYSGSTTISGGILETPLLANGGVASGIGGSASLPANLVLENEGTLKYTGPTVSIDRGATLNGLGGVIDVTNSSTTLTVGGTLVSTGAVAKAGSGTLSLTAPNSYSGGTVVNAGVLQVAAGSAGTGGVTNNGSTFRLSTTTTLANPITFNGNCTLDLANQAGNQALDGAWAGSGTVNFINQNAAAVRTFTIGGASGGNMDNFSGTINVGTNTGFFRFNDGGGTYNTGSSNAIFNLGTSTARLLNRNRATVNYLGALIGGVNTVVTNGSDSSGTTTFVVGGRNVDAIFDGRISGVTGADLAITKVGTGKWTLTGNNTYGGATTVEAGILEINGSLGNTPVTVTTGTLSGNGTLGGPVVVNYGGTLAPGSSIGQMTINNSLQLDSGSTNIMELDKANGTNDSIIGLTSISYGGTLTVNNLGGTLQAGDTFVLFTSSGGYGGAFEATNLPALSGNLVWDTSGLYVDGSIKVISAGGASFSYVAKNGSNIELSGSGGTAGATYYVLTSTNVALPLANWIPVETNTFDGNGNFGFTNAISPSVPKQFYLLQIPVP